jgi:hypothetical protein
MLNLAADGLTVETGHKGSSIVPDRARPMPLEHDPEKACPALDAGWTPVSRLREAHGTVRRFGLKLRRAKRGRKRSSSSKKLKRDDDSKKSHRA